MKDDDRTFITRGSTADFEGIMELTRVDTLAGKHGKAAKDDWKERVDEETKIWNFQKKQLEKSIIQANLNYLCIDEIVAMVQEEDMLDRRFKYQDILTKYNRTDYQSPLI